MKVRHLEGSNKTQIEYLAVCLSKFPKLMKTIAAMDILRGVRAVKMLTLKKKQIMS